MSLLSRYVLRQLNLMTVYALLALLSLYAFFDVLAEIGDMGEGNYSGGKMLLYVLMQVPAHAYELMPLAVLVGALLALSQLSASSELTVIKTSGISVKRLIGMLLQFGAIFALLTVCLGEWVMPTIGQYAAQFKLNATQNSVSANTSSGIWIKQPNAMINVAEMLPDGSLRNINIYRHNTQFELEEAIHAEFAVPNQDKHNPMWHLHEAALTRLGETETQTQRLPELDWQVAVNQELLNVLLVVPEQMSANALNTYVRYLQENHQQTMRYRLAWWRKLTYPFACLVMALVALAFTPQQNRHGNMGLKLFFGICLGLAFHFAGRLFGFTSQLYGVPPFLSAVLPSALFALGAVWLIRRQEKR
ncbi:LPS export ABC transporter permease LptG [Stenoxybacter acetivorans]|uniref:LPS export ABC transporter permease LptG n=1 Tax=Stenoxybacter acetivorans TaxID=422441 RepID=UPI0005615E44|nr:LPS export ABC transporter permease LptG [Stenoxybacter acetivorans]